MNEEAIKLLYDDLQTEFDVGTIDDFTLYLNDDTKREKFFNEIILPKYDVETIEDFETTYGLKKKTIRNYHWSMVYRSDPKRRKNLMRLVRDYWQVPLEYLPMQLK